MVQLGPLMYALLECVDGQRDVAELAGCLSERLGRRFDEEHVARLAEKLAEQGLLAGTEANAPERSNPLLGLRAKVLVTNPAITRRLTAPFTFLFRPWVVWPILALFVAVLWFVLVQKGLASATREAFDNPELLLLVFVLAIGSAAFHEIGHAAACRYGGGKPGGMGAGLYMVWPAFYTDVTDAYRLARHDRLRVDLGGLYFNAIVAVATVGAWFVWRVGCAAVARRPPAAPDGQAALAGDPRRRLPHPLRPHGGARPLRAHRPDAAPAAAVDVATSRPP